MAMIVIPASQETRAFIDLPLIGRVPVFINNESTVDLRVEVEHVSRTIMIRVMSVTSV